VKSHEIVLLQGAQSDILALLAVRGERLYHQVDKALEVLRLFPEIAPLHFGDW